MQRDVCRLKRELGRGSDSCVLLVPVSQSLGLSFQGRTKEILVQRNRIQNNKSVGMLACRGARVVVCDNDFLENSRTQVEVQGVCVCV